MMSQMKPSAQRRESLSFQSADIQHFHELVHERFGLHFSENRQAELERGIWQAYAASTASSPTDFYRLLQDPHGGSTYMQQLINALTVCETHFFRDEAQFDALYKHVLPSIIERRRSLRALRIWSAGCASGEEPYSLAIMLRELIPDINDWTITILGTDVNTHALNRARQAVFSDWAFREERSKQLRQRYFRPVGNRYALIPEVQRMVTFSHLNLAGDDFPSFQTNTEFMDLILCRNVTIYFSPEVVTQFVNRLYRSLVDGGWLVVGHSEHSVETYRAFKVHNFPNAVLYQRPGFKTAMLMGAYDGPLPLQGAPPPVKKPAPTEPLPALKAPPEPTPIEKALEMLEYGRSEEARELLIGFISTHSQHPEAAALLGRAYANLGSWQEAELWCKHAAEKNPLLLEAHYTLALVLQHQGKIEPAIQEMKKVVYLDRKHILGHYGLADLYQRTGQLPQALKSLDNARLLIQDMPEDTVIPDSGGVTAGRLREVITCQQQNWHAG